MYLGTTAHYRTLEQHSVLGTTKGDHIRYNKETNHTKVVVKHGNIRVTYVHGPKLRDGKYDSMGPAWTIATCARARDAHTHTHTHARPYGQTDTPCDASDGAEGDGGLLYSGKPNGDRLH
eukprot:4987855-Amphidinium_carterae.1